MKVCYCPNCESLILISSRRGLICRVCDTQTEKLDIDFAGYCLLTEKNKKALTDYCRAKYAQKNPRRSDR